MNVLTKNMAEKFYSYANLPVSIFLFFIFISGISHGKGMPGSFSDLVEKLSPSVVNITTSSTIPKRQELNPQLPPGSPFEDLFRDFMDREQNGAPRRQRRCTALCSVFIISDDGYVVTNNHVI
jgi:serine protease Do